MKIKIKIIYALILFGLLFQSCGGKNPSLNDIAGTWRSKDGAQFQFNKNGTFLAINLPRGTTHFPEDEISNSKFTGIGEWLLQKKQGSWEIELSFFKAKNLQTGYATQIKIAGSHGFFDENPPWYLFEWKEEEGGDRYIFKKL